MIGAPLSQAELNKRFVEACARIVANLEKLRADLETNVEQGRSVGAELDKIARLRPEEKERFRNYLENVRVWQEGRKLRIAQTQSFIERAHSALEFVEQKRTLTSSFTPGNQILPGVVAPGEDQPPQLGEFLICLFVCPERQEERLADFKEYYCSRWVPRFGRRIADVIYVGSLVWAAVDVLRITAWASAVDAVWRFWDR